MSLYKKVLSRISHFLFVFTLTAALIGCGSVNNTNNTVTYYGAPVQVGNGTAQAYYTLLDGFPFEVGVQLTPGALQNLPQLQTGQSQEFALPPPPHLTELTPFQGVSLYYSPGYQFGGSVGNQNVPQFHATWFVISSQQRAQVQQTNPPQSQVTVQNQYLPTNHATAATYPFIPTVGQIFIDAQNVPAYTSQGLATAGTEYDYFFYGGGMTAMDMGVANTFLVPTLSATSDFGMELPNSHFLFAFQSKPTQGYYPSAYQVRYNSTNQLPSSNSTPPPAGPVYILALNSFVIRT